MNKNLKLGIILGCVAIGFMGAALVLIAYFVELQEAGSFSSRFSITRESNAQKINRFTLALAQATARDMADKEENFIIAPYQAFTSSTFLASTLAGEPQLDLLGILFNSRVEKLESRLEEARLLQSSIMAANSHYDGLSYANTFWFNPKSVTWPAANTAAATKDFGFAFSAADFSNPTTAQSLNNWLAQAGGDFAPGAISPLSTKQALLVLNTLKFISAWNYPFDPHRTTPQPYTTDDKQKHTVQMMHRIFEEADALQWQERPDYEAAALGLGRDPESGSALLKLIIIRPKTQWLGAREWLTQVKAGKIPDWLRSKDFDPATGVVSLPRTYARSVQNILQPLKDIGAKPVFEVSSTPDAGAAEKAPALPAGNFLQHVVLHLVESTGAPPPNVKSIERLETPGSYVMMRVNRSFVFALVDNKSGVALALGVINKPGLPPEQRK